MLPASRSVRQRLDLEGHPRRELASSCHCRPNRPRYSISSRGCSAAGTSRSSTGRKAPGSSRVTGAAGGVGCTTLAVNLAATLAATKEQETILLDLDLLFGSVDACLDIAPDHTLSHVLQNFERLDLTLLKRSITRHASGLYVLPHPESMQDVAAIDPETLRRFFGLLRAAFDTVVDRYQQGASGV